MTTPEGRDPGIVLHADVAEWLRNISQAELAMRRLASTVQRDMRAATTSVNAATTALRQYAAAASAAGRVRTTTTGGGVGTAGVPRPRVSDEERSARTMAAAARRRQQDEARIAAAARRRAIEEEQANKRRLDSYTKVGAGVAIASAAITAGLVLSAKAAIDWQSAWTEVTKAVEGSDTELAQLEGTLRTMATTLPTSHREVAALAAAAGQMGVATDDIAAFTKTAIMLGVSTNLSAEDAITGLTKLINITGSTADEVGKLGAVLVDLGNNGESTEAEILKMSLRFGAAARAAGASATEVLAFANAASSAGIEAELGGGALQRVFLNMSAAVQTGSKDLAGFVDLAGRAGVDFNTVFSDSPAKALAAVITGLRQTIAAGGNATAALASIGVKGTQARQVMLSLANSSDRLNDSLDRAPKAYRESLALMAEFEKRAQTTAAKLQVARNSLRDFAIDVGGVLLPAIADAADTFAAFARTVQGLPGPLNEAGASLAGGAAAVGLLGGALLLLLPRIAATRTAMVGLGLSAKALGGSFALVAGIVAAAQFGNSQLDKWTASIDAATGRVPNVIELSKALADLGETAVVGGELVRVFGQDMDGFGAAVERALNPNKAEGFLSKLIDIGNLPLFNSGDLLMNGLNWAGFRNATEEAKEQVEATQASLLKLLDAGQAPEQVAKTFEDLARRAARAGIPVEEFVSLFPELGQRFADAKAKAEKSGKAMAGTAAATELMNKAIEEATKNVDDMVDAMSENTKEAKNAEDAYADWADGLDELADKVTGSVEDHEKLRDAIREVSDAANEGSAIDDYIGSLEDLAAVEPDKFGFIDRSLDGTSAAARENRDAVRGLIGETKELIAQNTRAGASTEEVAATTVQYKGALREQLTQLGFNAQAVDAMLGQLDEVPGKYDAAQKAVEQWTPTLDAQTKAGRENLKWLRDQQSAGFEDLANYKALGKNTDEVTARANAMAQEFDAAGQAAGFPLDVLRQYSDEIRNAPTKIDSQINVKKEQAKADLDEMWFSWDATAKAIEARQPEISLNLEKFNANVDEARAALADLGVKAENIDTFLTEWKAGRETGMDNRVAQRIDERAAAPASQAEVNASGGSPWFSDDVGVFRRARGGRISGPGGPRGDQIPAYLSDGEFIINAAATRQWLPLLNAINAGRVPGIGPYGQGQTLGGGMGGPGWNSGPGGRIPMPGGGGAGFSPRGAPVRLMYGSHEFDPFGRGLKYPGRRQGTGWMPGVLPRRFPRYADGGLVSRYQSMHSAPMQMSTPNVTVQGGSGGGIDYGRLAAAVSQAMAGVAVTMDGRSVGTVLIRQDDLQARGY